MRVGIVTFHRADNYGAVLQNYALINALGKVGVSATTIDYRCPEIERNYQLRKKRKISLSNPKSILSAIKYPFALNKEKARKAGFEWFRKEYIPMTDSFREEELADAELDFDAIIAGSDQIWNGLIFKGRHNPIYTLEFAPKGKKIAYAASAGNSELIPEESYKAISDIDFIMVREQELRQMLKEKLEIEAELCVDPVFLLDQQKWKSLISDRIVPGQIFLYRVGRGTQGAVDIARYYQKKCGGKIVYPMPYDRKIGVFSDCRYTAGPLEFLQMIWESEFIVASSFHAVAFSLIFEKDFVVLPQKDTNSRVKDLLKLVGLENRMFESFEDYRESCNSLTSIDYSTVRKTIKEEREKSLLLLQKALDAIE